MKKGYNQVLWLDAKEHRFVEEVGAMNIFFVFEDKLVTPALTGTILPGITRKIVLEISRSLMDHRVEKLSLSALYSAEEVFITGSGKGLVPVVQVDDHMIGDGRPGPKTKLLLEALALQKSNQDIP